MSELRNNSTISVVIPTYKNRGGLNNSVDSALAQDYEGLLEVIVVDDNFPESEERKNTECIMARYSKNPKVVYIRHNQNMNGAAARNTGIKASKGDYIAFLDDDDIFLKGKLTKQVTYLEKHKEFDAVYCFATSIKYNSSHKIIEGDGTRDILLLESNFPTISLVFRREALEAINGFDETFYRHQDYELMLRFFANGYKIGCVPEVLVEQGINKGENIPKGKKMDELKAYFLSKFRSVIQKEDAKTPGFANKVYAKHYAEVFLSYIKTKHLGQAVRVFTKYFFNNPYAFTMVIFTSARLHLTKWF